MFGNNDLITKQGLKYLGTNDLTTALLTFEPWLLPQVIFYEDDEMLIFPNIKSAQRSKDGSAAAMSFVHYLVIPKKRIYNSVTLVPAHIPMLKRMKQRGVGDKLADYYLSLAVPNTTTSF